MRHNISEAKSFWQPGRPCLASQLEGDEREGGRELLSKTQLLSCCADHFNTQSCDVCPEILQITGPGINSVSHRSQWREADLNTSPTTVGCRVTLTPGNTQEISYPPGGFNCKFCVHLSACPPCLCFLSPSLSPPWYQPITQLRPPRTDPLIKLVFHVIWWYDCTRAPLNRKGQGRYGKTLHVRWVWAAVLRSPVGRTAATELINYTPIIHNSCVLQGERAGWRTARRLHSPASQTAVAGRRGTRSFPPQWVELLGIKIYKIYQKHYWRIFYIALYNVHHKPCTQHPQINCFSFAINNLTKKFCGKYCLMRLSLSQNSHLA